jgi:hypothetical protein
MVATSVNAARGVEALRRLRELVEQHGNAEQLARLDRVMGGPVPAPNRAPVECAVYQAEALVILFEMVAELAAAVPKRRGRKPKAKQAS